MNMASKTLVARDIRSWKAAGERIAYLDKRGFLYLVRDTKAPKTERIDDDVTEFQLTQDALVFETADGSLFVFQFGDQ
jgi:hypothetical protein